MPRGALLLLLLHGGFISPLRWLLSELVLPYSLSPPPGWSLGHCLACRTPSSGAWGMRGKWTTIVEQRQLNWLNRHCSESMCSTAEGHSQDVGREYLEAYRLLRDTLVVAHHALCLHQDLLPDALEVVEPLPCAGGAAARSAAVSCAGRQGLRCCWEHIPVPSIHKQSDQSFIHLVRAPYKQPQQGD